MTLEEKAFENIEGKGENADNQHFLSFPQCFLPYQREIPSFQQHFFFVICKCFHLDQSKILPFGKELTLYQITKF